jgi:hypothetical protein
MIKMVGSERQTPVGFPVTIGLAPVAPTIFVMSKSEVRPCLLTSILQHKTDRDTPNLGFMLPVGGVPDPFPSR